MKDFRVTLTEQGFTQGNWFRDRFELGNGMYVSIQASERHDSSPRISGLDATEYTQFELGYPDFCPPDYILVYAEDKDDPTETVYPYVPYELIQKMLEEMSDVMEGTLGDIKLEYF
jgi:hypothetical protein